MPARMPHFYALVDARPGQESLVEGKLQQIGRIDGLTRCKSNAHDFLIRFDAGGFDVVDDFLRTHVQPVPGVAGVEIIQDWDDHPSAVRDARARVDG